SLHEKPKVLVSASAIGFYGDRGDEVLREESASGEGFLSEVCREWEKATLAASQAGIRVVHLRIGVVLSAEGGALPKMLTPFKLGVGGRVGSGKQYMSWIALDDLIGIIKRALDDERLRGPVNAVAPNAVTNEQFTKALGGALGRPTILPVPAFAARLAFGEMADALLLSSTRVEPARLKEAGHEFKHAELEGALRHVLKKK
ncbi:MAG TPA: TIGR01777 family oxidoreductase, partial [Pyrinomonadaceae bacterium]|nr:TIGR01777 family oxidoreductase [Pyrinomonadaceae bacterium]